jgi:hypothetical protein
MKARIPPTQAERRDSQAPRARLSDDGRPEAAGGSPRQQEAALTHPYMGGRAAGSPRGQLRRHGRPEPGYDGHQEPASWQAAAPDPPASGFSGRAVIGDQIRKPILWCQMGSCITWYADPAALGEADNRARAVAAGWRQDALGRIACPSCLQDSPQFRATYPVVPWSRERAVTVAALMAVAAQDNRQTVSEAAAETGWTPVTQPAAHGEEPARHARDRGKHRTPAWRGPAGEHTPRTDGNLRRPEVTLPVNHVWDGLTSWSDSQA